KALNPLCQICPVKEKCPSVKSSSSKRENLQEF
ncbi:MAG: hypothetical protein ACE5NN_06500, partial [Candidatus Bathyarchaeia archaeon]